MIVGRGQGLLFLVKDFGTGSMGARGEENGSATALAGKDPPELLK
jgi:hypothetical protein